MRRREDVAQCSVSLHFAFNVLLNQSAQPRLAGLSVRLSNGMEQAVHFVGNADADVFSSVNQNGSPSVHAVAAGELAPRMSL